MNRYGVFSFLLLLLLAACGESHEQMLRQLEELERMNRADSVMRNDTLAQQLTQYFDRHGDSNERMRAHYILGRTYADMGNSPDALKTHRSAIDKYDTLSKDCDFILLSKIYGQMASLYEDHRSHRYSLSANQSGCHFAMKGRDTLQARIIEQNLINTYQLNKHNGLLYNKINSIASKYWGGFGIRINIK